MPAWVTRPLTPSNWPDLETIFEGRGCSVARGCWCMYYRKSGAGWPSSRSEQGRINRAELKALVDAGHFTGLIAYRGKEPVGWLSFGPRDDFGRINRSPILKRVDDEAVWPIVCFVVPSAHRGQGVARALLDAAVAYCRKKKVKLVEGYPVDKAERSDDQSMWFGAKTMFDAAGFDEVERRKPGRPIVRLHLA